MPSGITVGCGWGVVFQQPASAGTWTQGASRMTLAPGAPTGADRAGWSAISKRIFHATPIPDRLATSAEKHQSCVPLCSLYFTWLDRVPGPRNLTGILNLKPDAFK